MTTNSTHSAAPALFKKVPSIRSRISPRLHRIGSFPSVVVVNPTLKVNSIQELVALMPRPSGSCRMATETARATSPARPSSTRRASTSCAVSYRSNPVAITDLIAGHILVMILDLNNALPQIAEKNMRPLAVLTKTRSPSLPDVPTLDESVIPGFDLCAWAGLFGPANLPPEVVEKIAGAIGAALAKPDIQEKFKNSGIEPYWGDTAEFKKFVAAELVKWTSVIKSAGIEPE